MQCVVYIPDYWNEKVTFIESFYFQVDTFTAVYKKLTGKDVAFEFPEYVL